MTTTGYYKREVSLMDERIFPRFTLDQSPENPDPLHSHPVNVVEQTDDEVVRYVVEDLKRIPKL